MTKFFFRLNNCFNALNLFFYDTKPDNLELSYSHHTCIINILIIGMIYALQENIKDSEGKNRQNIVGISLFRRHTDETRRRK